MVLIVGFALFASSMPIFVLPLLAIGVLIAAHEWTKLMPKCRQPVQFILAVLIITMLSVALPWTWVFWWAVSLGIWVMATAWVATIPQ